MKTDQLIRALVADRPDRALAMWRVLALAVLAGFGLSALLFGLFVPLREDLATALSSPRFMLKPAELLLLVAASALLAIRLVQPGAAARGPALASAIVPAIVIVALLVELMLVPQSQWMIRLAGVHWYVCLANIVLLALPVLAALLIALRIGAPTRPALAGAAAGLFAGALSASLYITHCPDDSPLFVAAWYSLAIAAVAAIGAVAGSRVLRW